MQSAGPWPVLATGNGPDAGGAPGGRRGGAAGGPCQTRRCSTGREGRAAVTASGGARQSGGRAVPGRAEGAARGRWLGRRGGAGRR